MENPFEIILKRLDNIEKSVRKLFDKIDIAIKKSEVSEIKNQDGILNTRQAAEYLNISINTLYGKIQRKEIPHYKPHGSKRVLFKKSDLERYVTKGKLMSNDEIDSELKKRNPPQ